jgi:hypothetical protein
LFNATLKEFAASLSPARTPQATQS